MKVTIKRLDTAFHLEGNTPEGKTLQMDSAPGFGGANNGFRPMELLLTALGGCSAIDVINILKKQKQEPASLQIEVEGLREKTGDYSLFRSIHLHFIFKGLTDAGKAERAVNLSLNKYCSVAKTLDPTAKINYTITVLNNEDEHKTF